MIKIPLTWHFWNITIPKTPYISSLKSLGYCTFWNFWACQKKITFDILFGSPCINIFYSSQATWRYVAINPYPLNGSSALHLFGSQQSQLRAMRYCIDSSTSWKLAAGTSGSESQDCSCLQDPCAHRVTEPVWRLSQELGRRVKELLTFFA